MAKRQKNAATNGRQAPADEPQTMIVEAPTTLTRSLVIPVIGLTNEGAIDVVSYLVSIGVHLKRRAGMQIYAKHANMKNATPAEWAEFFKNY